MIVAVLASVAIPLRTASLQVAGETIARGAVQSKLSRLISSDVIVSQRLRIDSGRIYISLISMQPVPKRVEVELRESIERRTGRAVDLSVDAVASKSELADLLESLRTPVPTPPKVETLEDMQKALAAKVQAALEEIWPLKEAPLREVSLGLDPNAVALNVRYEAAADLGPIPAELLQKSLRDKLGLQNLTLNLERTPPPRGRR